MNKVEDSSQPLLVQQSSTLQIEPAEEHNTQSIIDLHQETTCTERFKNLFKKTIQKCKRQVYMNGNCLPQNQQSNMIKNSKYNAITFLPLVLYEQFHQFINLFYLGLTITQFIDAFKVGFLIGYLGPLALVVTLSLLKELYDDIKRHNRDRQINRCAYQRLTQTGLVPITSGELEVGMIIKVNSNQRIPADMVILSASEEQVFIRTDQLDGETDWKLRKPIQYIQNRGVEQVFDWPDSYISCEPPQENIYTFFGVFKASDVREALSLENALWAGTVLANGSVYGLVTYTGAESRMQMNSRTPKTKFGKIDNEINKMSMFLFGAMAILSVIITFLSQPPMEFMFISVLFVRYLILLSNIIPISMRVNVEFAKLIYCYKITIDRQIEGTIPRNSNIPESLGRIEYLLTDKTGTLTQNDMIFKKLSLEHGVYTQDDFQQMRNSLKINKNIGVREEEAILRDLLIAVSLCHNVTPIEGEDGRREYQASSPDEIALVKIAENLGVLLEGRDQNSITISYNEQTIKYQILNNFPFSSETKRMGIIVKFQSTYVFYLKGADSVMKQCIQETQRGFIDEECENLARDGLRTLVITQKILTEQEYNQWRERFEKANIIENINSRERELKKCMNILEKNMQFLGITGVEDKLQEDVCQTLENIRQAGISVWMLTGDKIETAICISISSGIKSPTQDIYQIKDIADEETLQQRLQQFDTRPNSILVIDGISLSTAFKKEELFFRVATQAQSVVCCRCSPTQKAQVTECIRKYTKKITACVGDGGNDVGMIQSADIGIGIEGKEGKQAALASDFSILKFKYLNQLLLWHGRLSYKRSALLSQFVVHRGLIISIIQTAFMCIYYYLSISIFSPMLIFGYATLYTMFPVFSIIFDEDVDEKIALQFPPLYKSLQKGRDLNAKTFMIWVWKATYQGVMIMIAAQLFYEGVFLYIETVAFTALIITEFCLIFSELHSIHLAMILSTLGSIVFYVLTMIYLPEQLVVTETQDWMFWLYVIIIVGLSWLPIYFVQLGMQKLQPNDYQKIMNGVQKRRIKINLFN